MNNLLEIMDKESCSKSEVYLYEEEGRWYAFLRCYVRQGRSRPEQTAERSVVCCPVFRH